MPWYNPYFFSLQYQTRTYRHISNDTVWLQAYDAFSIMEMEELSTEAPVEDNAQCLRGSQGSINNLREQT